MRTFAKKTNTTQQTTSAISPRVTPLFFGQSRGVSSVLHLQRTIGNHAVQRLLQSKPKDLAAGKRPSAVAHNITQIPVYSNVRANIQPKLKVNTPGDPYEREADRVADQVMRMPDAQTQRGYVHGEEANPKGQTEQTGQRRPVIQRKAGQAHENRELHAQGVTLPVLRSRGRPLETGTRDFFESRLGYDFGQVRVHTDAAAEHSAQEINADAYTLGTDIAFGAGQYRPQSEAGRRLLAHELTHVVQQSSSTHGPANTQAPGHNSQPHIGFSNTLRASHPMLMRQAVQGSHQVENHVPSTGLGILNGEYREGPQNTPGVLTVTLRIGLLFFPTIQPNQGQSSPQAGWTPLQQAAYRSNYKALIERAWSRRYQLRRDAHGRTTAAEVDVHVEYAPYGQADFNVMVWREQPGQQNRDFVSHPEGSGPIDDITHQHTGPQRTGARAYDSGLRSTPDTGFLGRLTAGTPIRTTATIYFQPNSAEVDPMNGSVNRLADFRDAIANELHSGHRENIQVEVRGYTDGEMRSPRSQLGALSLRRAEATRDFLSGLILNRRVEIVAIPGGPRRDGDPESRNRAEISARWAGQRTAAHEAGHMIGLGDEYVEPERAGQARGDQATHSALAQRMGMSQVLVGEDPRGIMAGGNQFRPHHYVTFAELLARITHTPVEEWRIVEAGSPLRGRRTGR